MGRMNMSFLTKHILGPNFQDVAQEMTNFLELHNLILSVATEGAASAALSDPSIDPNSSTTSAVANSCFIPYFLNNPDRPLPYLSDPSSQSSSSSSSHGPHELFIDFHGFLPHGLLSRLILNLGEKCEASSVNLSNSRLSEEGVEGGSWEMSASDSATFNFNLTNSISYEVDLEPLTLCNSARVTFRWPEEHRRGHDVLAWFRDLVSVTMPMCGIQYHLGPNCPAKACAKKRASTALAMGPSSLAVPSRLHVIDLNPSQPVVCAKERIDLHPSIAKWLPTAPLNRGNNPEVLTQFQAKLAKAFEMHTLIGKRIQTFPDSGSSSTPHHHQMKNQAQHHHKQFHPQSQHQQQQQQSQQYFSDTSMSKTTPSRPASRCSGSGRESGRESARLPTSGSTSGGAAASSSAAAATFSTATTSSATNAPHLTAVSNASNFSPARFSRKEASETVDESASAAVSLGGASSFGGGKLKDAENIFAATNSNAGSLPCK